MCVCVCVLWVHHAVIVALAVLWNLFAAGYGCLDWNMFVSFFFFLFFFVMHLIFQIQLSLIIAYTRTSADGSNKIDVNFEKEATDDI